MANFADALKAEIARLVRKETKTEFERLRKLAASHRSEIVSLKRDIKSLHTQVNGLARSCGDAPAGAEASVDTLTQSARNFGPQTLIALRKKLGVSQEDMALLLECSALSIGRWEAGKAVPRRAQLLRIVKALDLSKESAAANLEQIKKARG
jgi:DNA-binding transcriptional regulator YiaG